MTEELEQSGFIPLINTDEPVSSTKELNEENKSAKSKKEEEAEKPKIIRKALMLFPDDISNAWNHGLYEAIYFGGEPYFLRCFNADRNNNSTKMFSLEHSIVTYEESINGMPKKVVYQPKVTSLELLPFDYMETGLDSALDYKNYAVPTTQQLFDRIYTMLKLYADISADWLNVCSLMVLMSYEQEKFNWLPYLGIFGDTGSGKSVLTELMSHLCYRCGYFFEVNSADIYQYLSEYEGTIPSIAEDEIQGFEQDKEKIKIYKSGNSRSGKVPRIIQKPNGCRELVNFPTFSFKILTGEQVPTVKGLNERIIAIPSSKGKPAKHWYDRTNEEIAEIKKLKWDLLKWRMANHDKTYSANINATSRIEDNLKPLRVIAKGLSIEQNFERWAKEAIQKSETEKKSTIEGCTVEAVYALVNRGLFASEVVLQGQQIAKIYLSFDAIWEQVKNVTLGTLENDKLQTIEFGEVTKNKIGRVLTDILDSKSVTRVDEAHTKVRFRSFNVEMLLRVVSNYFDEQETERLKQKIQEEGNKPNDSLLA